MRVRLTRKFAERIDGIDLSNHDVGDVIDLPAHKGRLLMAEGWAERERRSSSMGPFKVLAFRRDTDPGHTHDHDEPVSQAS